MVNYSFIQGFTEKSAELNCCCVLVRKVATLHVATPTIVVHDPTRVQRSLGRQDKKVSVMSSGRGLPTHTGSPYHPWSSSRWLFCWHTLHSRLWDMVAPLNTLPTLRMACRAIVVTKVQHNVLLFPFLPLTAAPLVPFAMVACTCQFSGFLLVNIQDRMRVDVILSRQKKLKHVGHLAGVS